MIALRPTRADCARHNRREEQGFSLVELMAGMVVSVLVIGSTLSIAVDPNNSDIVYVAWADRINNGATYTVHLRRSTNRGVSWSGDLVTVPNATNAAVALSKMLFLGRQ